MQRRTGRRKKKKKSGRLIGTLILVGLLAIGCGWTINRLIVQGYLFRPAIERDDPNVSDLPPVDPPGQDEGEGTGDPTPVTEARLKLQSFRFYLLQVGALSNEVSAENLVRRLAADGYPGAYIKEGKFYKVFAGIYSQKEAADAVSQMLKELKHEVFVKEAAIAGGDYTVNDSNAPYFAASADHLTAIDSAFGDLLAASSIDGAKASTLKEQVDGAHERLSALNPSEGLTPYHSALLDACAELLAAVNQLNTYLESNNELDLIQTNSSLLDFALDYQAVQSIIRDLLL